MSVSQTLLGDLPGHVAELVAGWLPDMATVRGFVGRLDLPEVTRIGLRAPAVLVSRFGGRLDTTLAGPHHLYLVDMAAFVLTKDAPGLDRNAAAAAITQALLTRLPQMQVGIDGVGHAQDVAEHSLDTAETKKNGVALWVVTWRQRVALTDLPEPEPISPALYVGLAPRIGSAHEADYDLIGGEQ